jgi:hypothetical protein
MEIIGFMSRTLYSTKKSRILSGLVGEEWERRVVTQLDSSLNGWKDSLPSHRESLLYVAKAVANFAVWTVAFGKFVVPLERRSHQTS